MIEFVMQALLGGSIRFAEAIMSSGPTLLVGLFIAAIFRYFLGTEGTRRLFGGDSLRALPQSWAVGMLLPVCSIGVLPVLLEMRRSGIKPGAMSAFALAAPLFNPLSLLYGLTLSRPYVIVMFAMGSLAVVTLVGLIWDKFFLRQTADEITESNFLEIAGVQRLAATFIFMCRQLCGPAGLWALIAAVGMATLAAFLPWGGMQHGVNRDDWWAPARMTMIAIPAYATPMLIMSQLGMMFQHANSPGAAFILLVLGAGVNFGTIGWLGRQFGIRSVAMWLGCLVVIVLAIAYAVNKPLIPPGVDPSDHTHAFDIYSNPIHHLDSAMGSFALQKLEEKIGIAERITLWALGIGLVLGAVFRIFSITCEKPRQRSKSAATDAQPYGRFDRAVSERAVGGTLLAGLVALSVVMCYAYYPSTDECLKQISHVRAETLSAARSGDSGHAMFWIPRWDEWSRRLEVGTFIRRGKVTPYQRMQGYLIRKKLETLEHELAHDHDDPAMVRAVVEDVSSTNSRWVRAFRNLPPIQSPFGSAEPIVADPNVDSEHDHRHFHDDGQSHDHDHEDFVGAHDHDHAHGHRHDEAPHGGKIVDLGHNQHAGETGNFHLEVMPIRDGKIEIYPLQYKIGLFRPVKDPDSSLTLRLSSSNASQTNQDVKLDLELDTSTWVFQKPLPNSFLSSESREVLATFESADRKLEAFIQFVGE
jgi:uncharacterized membrane protein YraQ (UPF0718 family)